MTFHALHFIIHQNQVNPVLAEHTKSLFASKRGEHAISIFFQDGFLHDEAVGIVIDAEEDGIGIVEAGRSLVGIKHLVDILRGELAPRYPIVHKRRIKTF